MHPHSELALGLYPQASPRKLRLGSAVMSLTVHGLAVLVLAALHFESVPDPVTRPRSVTLVAPTPLDLRPDPPDLPKARRDMPLAPAPALTEKLPVAPRVARAFQAPERQAVRPSPIASVELPVAALAAPNAPTNASPHLPVIPAPPLKTDNFGTVELASTAPVTAPAEVAGFGSAGVSSAAPKTSATTAAGFGAAKGTGQSLAAARAASTGGFASTAFEKTAGRSTAVNTAPSSFGNALVATAPAAAAKTHASGDTPVEILEKPNPVYTDEARRLRIEGEVLLQILFPATGSARVLRVLRGLGHGLDESAIAAAQAIQFRPAIEGGHAVDSTAVVRIAFQVAY